MDFEKVLTNLAELGTTWGLRVLGVIIVLIVTWMVAGWLDNRIRTSLDKRKFDKTLTRFFAKFVRYTILISAILGCLGVFGIQTASFAALIAAAGLAIGLAFQGSLSNFASGVMLLVFRPFKVGDFVRLDGEMGFVREIELFTTEIATTDNRRLIVPSSRIFGAKIENFTAYDTRRVDVPVGVEYPADIDETRKVFEKVVAEVDKSLSEPAPQVFLSGLGDSSVDWVLRVWCKTPDYWDVYQSIIRDAKKALDGAKIGIPFPQMDLHLDDEVVKAISKKAA